MKKNLLNILSIITIYSSPILAQPTLTATGINPVEGDMYNMGNSSLLSPGSGGANQTWNFTSASTSSIYYYTYAAASSTPYSSDFSTSDLDLQNTTNYNFFKITPTAFQSTGNASQSMVVPYQDYHDYLRFPFNFNDSFIDSFGGISTDLTYTTSGTYTITYDGYGTLILPDGASSITLNNAVRIHAKGNYTYNNPGGPINNIQDEYQWYVNGIHNLIAYTSTITSNTQTYKSSGYNTDLFTSVKELKTEEPEVTIYPNPATDELNFTIHNKVKLKNIQIYDMTGKLKITQEVNALDANNHLTVKLTDFSSGIYLVKFISTDGSAGTKKINVTK